METAIGTVAIAVVDGQRTRDTLAILAAGAAFADIAMLDLPAAIRDRPGALTPIERKAVERHPEGSQARMRALGIVVRARKSRYARTTSAGTARATPAAWRGASSPPPPEARYVALADTYATLTVARRGAPRLSGGDALREMAGSTGQFDPDLLRILVHLLAGSARVDCAARDEGA